MSSSTFEVKEPESESEKVLEFGLATCEENGIEMSTSIDGEIAKDHTYTKEPDVEEKEESKDSGTEDNTAEEMEDASLTTKKRSGRLSRGKKAGSPAVTKGKTKKVAIPKKESTRKSKKRETINEEVAAEPEETTNNKEEAEVETPAVEATPKTSKRGKKRKVEEKENVIDQSIVEEVQNITEDPAVNEVISESTPKKAKPDTPKAKKTPKSKIVSSGEIENDDKLPKGWIKKTVVRKSGKTAGIIDVYIYSPDGIKFRSRPDIAAYLAKTKSPLKVENFDFSKKKASTGVNSPKTPVKARASPSKEKPEKKKKSSPTKSSKILVMKVNDSKKKKSAKVTKKSKTPIKSGKAKKTPLKSNKKKKTA